MRTRGLFIQMLCLLGSLLLTGCSVSEPKETESAEERVLISVAEGENFTVTNNGQRIFAGEDATFEIFAEPGYALTETDYGGGSRLWQEGERILLTLEDVRYPTRVHLTLSNRFFSLTYDPNGGEGERFTVRQEKKYHLRPNTSTGEELLPRPGYTLLGWNTAPDGSGTAVGLGSRATVPEEGLTLYAQWAEWTEASAFLWERAEDGVYITGYTGTEERLVIPETLGGAAVIGIGERAFAGCTAKTLVLPRTLQIVEEEAFAESHVKTLYLFDNIESIGDSALKDCSDFTTLRINAAEAPYGYAGRKESCYADKVDLLICARGKRKLVFYGGCSMWYNLDVKQVLEAYGDRYEIIDMALNGTVNSQLQLEILSQYMEKGDVLFHTPELSSPFQMLTTVHMGKKDTPLWSGLEYNYDLLALADMRHVTGVLDSFSWYLSRKQEETSYEDRYTDSRDRSYFGPFGEVPFQRYEPIKGELGDDVTLTSEDLRPEGLERLGCWYKTFAERGIEVYLSYACINRDALPEGQWENAEEVEAIFRAAAEQMEGVTLISHLKDYVYTKADFYDTNYHLLSSQVSRNTRCWLRDLAVYLPPSQ